MVGAEHAGSTRQELGAPHQGQGLLLPPAKPDREEEGKGGAVGVTPQHPAQEDVSAIPFTYLPSPPSRLKTHASAFPERVPLADGLNHAHRQTPPGVCV